MAAINMGFALCLSLPLIVFLTLSITLALRKRISWLLLGSSVCALALAVMIGIVTQPVYEEADEECQFGGAHQEYLACRAERKRQNLDPRPEALIAVIAVPTLSGVVASETFRWFWDKKHPKQRPIKVVEDAR